MSNGEEAGAGVGSAYPVPSSSCIFHAHPIPHLDGRGAETQS